MVALGAALWGSDAFFRRALSIELPSTVIVAVEHLVIAIILFPVLWSGRQVIRNLRGKQLLALLVIGVGSSALATVLFTAAFSFGDPNTPLLLQKLQPLFAIAAAIIILGERVLPRFALYFLAALAGAFLMTFPEPRDITTGQIIPAILAVAAAVLWGLGTVLGRYLSPTLNSRHLTAFRVAIGLAALVPVVLFQGHTSAMANLRQYSGALVLLALIPGLFALLIYYRGLKSTPASAATVAELAFPLSALTINYIAFDAKLTGSQWVGLVLLSSTIAVMALIGRWEDGAYTLGIEGKAAPATSLAGIR